MKKNIIITFFLTFIFFSCEKLEDVEVPKFDVTTERVTYKVGESVNFAFNGDPDLITFYSGEVGNDYEYRKGRHISSSFKAQFDQQMLDGRQDNQMSILLSTDFSGVYNIDQIKAANWIDISDKFKMLKSQETRLFVSTGLKDISELLQDKDSVKLYVAVRQIVKDQTVYGTANLNRIRGFSISAESIVGITPLYNHTSLEWSLISTPNKETGRASITSTWLEFRGNVTNKTAETEDWAISKQIKFVKNSYVGPDWGVSIKGLSDKRINTYTYSYTKPGIYKVVFISVNMNANDRKETIKEIELNIEP
ncbi:MAG: DUF5017 domain-containing protein [Bacteroidota bacterium]